MAAGLGVVALTVGIALALTLGGGGSPKNPEGKAAPQPGSPSPSPSSTGQKPRPHRPRFHFKLAGVRRVSTTLLKGEGKKKKQEVRQATGRAAREIRSTLESLFRLGFLTPKDWQSGKYGPIYALFGPKTRSAAKRDIEELTLGADAGHRFVSVIPTRSTLKLQILLDRVGHPGAASASANFNARARGRKGHVTVVASKAQLLLRRSGKRWVVVGFRVQRLDHIAKGT